MRAYTDFSLQIGPVDAKGFRVRAQCGEAVAKEWVRISLLSDGALDALGRLVSRGDVTRDVEGLGGHEPSGVTSPEAFGESLYSALFQGKIAELFARTLPRPGEDAPCLRICLHLNLDDESATLASLPWEVMHRHGQPLVLSGDTTLVRSVELDDLVTARPFFPPLRVLFITSNPAGDLKLDKELDGIRQRLEQKPDVRVDVLADATVERLSSLLYEKDFEVVHFMGHGTFEGGAGRLLMADGRKLTGRDLGLLLLGEKRNTRLIVLNACRTGEITRDHGQDPFAGVATALVRNGFPAVVAMQFPVSDDAAIAFADRFYSTIMRGGRVEQAVEEGRRGMIAVAPERAEWATPVLFLRGTGNLFVPAAPAIRADVKAAPIVSRMERKDLPYMLDRTTIMDGLRRSIIRQKAGSPPTLLVGVIHGNEEQCQTQLMRRLYGTELPNLLSLDTAVDKVVHYHVGWPVDLKDPAGFRAALLANLARSIGLKGVDVTFDQVCEQIVSLPAPAMIFTQVLGEELSSHGCKAAVENFLLFWQAVPRRPGVERIYTFLFVKYRTLEETAGLGFFKRKQAERRNEKVTQSNDEIRRVLNEMSEASERFGGIVLSVLPELGEVSEQDVENWAGEHGQLDLLDDLRALIRGRGTRTLPMAVIADAIVDLMKVLDHPKGEVA